MIKPLALISSASLFALSSASIASAFDAKAYIDNIIAENAKIGVKMEYDRLDETGDDGFTLSGLKLFVPEQENPLTVNTITLGGIEELEGAGIAAETMSAEGFSFNAKSETGETVEVTIENMDGTGLYYPDPADFDAPLVYFQNTIGNVNNMTMKVDDETVFEMPRLAIETRCNDDKTVCGTAMGADGMTVDLKKVDNPGFKGQREKLGYDTLTMDLNLKGKWETETGLIEISQYEMAARDVGSLNMTLKVLGYTNEFARKSRELSYTIQQQALEAQKDGAEANTQADQMEAMRMMSLMGELQLEALSISFTDASITNKVLDLQAAQMDSTREELSQMVPMMAGMGLAALENPEFSQMVTGALTAYFANPGNLSIEAKPEAPVSFGDIMGAGMAAPQTLINLLNVQVNANQ